MKILNIRIAQLRKQNGLTQSQLAKAIGVSPSCVSKWEKGLNAPRTKKLILIAKFFNKKLDFLLGLIN